MENTANLSLPYIMPSQAQKHVTHNEALRMLDALVQLSALDRDRTAPPSAPSEGDRHIVGAAAGGLWEGRDGQVAAWQDGAWAYFQPAEGWRVWVGEDEALLVFHDGQWQPIGGALQNLDMVGINAAADAVNRLAVASEAVLFNHEGEGHQLKINKAASGDTASLLFQTGFSGRAEMGTAGDDDFRFKVSGDGASWHEAIVIEGGTGAVSFPNTVLAAGRERLTADRTYHVRTDGDDGNDGLTDSSAGAFRTIGRAIDEAYGGIDLGPFNVTIQLGDGIYEEQLTLLAPHVGAGTITIAGNGSNPANTVIAANVVPSVVNVLNNAGLHLRDLEIRRTGSGNVRCIDARRGGSISIGQGMRFGAAGIAHVHALEGGTIILSGATYAVVGNAPQHWSINGNSNLAASNVTVDVTGRHFATAFATASRGGVITAQSGVFNGTATGRRYNVTTNGVIFTNQGESYLPGDTAGTTAAGGQYG